MSPKTADNALVSITITFVFDKVKKCVVLFKDIKRLDKGKWVAHSRLNSATADNGI